jgi:hypothetical protein
LIEAVPVLRIVGSVSAIAVEQPGTRIRQIAVPHFIGALRQREGLNLPLAGRIEQAKVDALRVGGKHREIGAEAVPGAPSG